jgi:hypothetical protein
MTEDQERRVGEYRERMHRRGVPGDEVTDEEILGVIEGEPTGNRPTWRESARDTILRALVDGRSRGLDGAALVAAVDAAYPFGLRANHPYKQWLSERRAILESEGLLTPRPDKPRPLFANLEE